MTSKPMVQVALKLTGQGFSAEDITRITELTPTKTWRQGDQVQASKLVRKNDGWVLGLPERETYDLDGLLIELLDSIEPKADRVFEAIGRFTLEPQISFGVYLRGEAPACLFSSGTIKRICALGAALDIDLILGA